MYLKFSIVSLLSGLFSIFFIQILNEFKKIMLTITVVDTSESKLPESYFSTSLIYIPIIFFVLSGFFYFMNHNKENADANIARVREAGK